LKKRSIVGLVVIPIDGVPCPKEGRDLEITLFFCCGSCCVLLLLLLGSIKYQL